MSKNLSRKTDEQKQNLSLDDYLGRAGGLVDNARKRKIYDEGIVPEKHLMERPRLSTGKVIGIATAVTSFAGVLFSLLINAGK